MPMIISHNLEHRLEEFFFLFELYNNMKPADVMKILRGFPYAFTISPKKMK